MKRLLLASACLLVAACNNSSGEAISEEPAGANCPAGGVKIVSGGKTQFVCNGSGGADGTNGSNGSNGAASLVKQTPLSVGDAQCPGGGVRIDTGLDTGGDGGVANDGTLEAAEITATTFVCADSSAKVGSMDVPAGAAGTATINASGGHGDAGLGGPGGTIAITIDRGTNGGHLKSFKTGHVDATFSSPTPLTGDLGAVPVNVTADTAVPEYDTDAPGTTVDAGAVFIFGPSLYVASGTAAPGTVATGLSVAAGVTLTLPSRAVNTFAPLELQRSCRNAGTIRLAATPGASGRFVLNCGDFEGAVGSRLEASGHGGDAGDAGVAGSDFDIVASGALRNHGTLVATGGAGNPAGVGGTIRLTSVTSTLVNTGAISVGGGAGLGPANGATGGTVSLNAGLDLLNSGALDASGGSGRSGGRGGWVLLGTSALRNTGPLTANGSPGSAACALGPPCAGGSGGMIHLNTAQGSLMNDATLAAKGGDSAGDRGGAGGQVLIAETSYTSTRFGSLQAPTRSVLVSGSIDVSGGSGTSGGGGGLVAGTLDFTTLASGAELQFLGYSAFLARGGNGSTGGGAGGVLVESQRPGTLIDYSAEFGGAPVPAGATLNTVDLFATGGSCPVSSASGSGGTGGSVQLRTQHDAYFADAPWEVLVNQGAIDASGGAGPTAGSGGAIDLYGRTGASSTGALTTNGGAGATAGGAGGSVVVAADDGPTTQSGATQLKGGAASGTGVGGAGGRFGLEGTQATLSGTIDASGGGSGATGGRGGQGGTIDCQARGGAVSVTVAPPAGLSVAGGAAAKPGAPGFVVIDGAQVTSAWTH